MPVELVAQIEDLGETRARPRRLVPGPGGVLAFEQVADAVADRGAALLARRDQAHHRPRRLAGRRRTDARLRGIGVAGDALAPAAVAVLVPEQPLHGAAHVWRRHVLADAGHPAQHL